LVSAIGIGRHRWHTQWPTRVDNHKTIEDNLKERDDSLDSYRVVVVVGVD
jgi:hypothetical protein